MSRGELLTNIHSIIQLMCLHRNWQCRIG